MYYYSYRDIDIPPHTYTHTLFLFNSVLLHIYAYNKNVQNISSFRCQKPKALISYGWKFTHDQEKLPEVRGWWWLRMWAAYPRKEGWRNMAHWQISELCKNTICGDNCAGSYGVGGSSERNTVIWKRQRTFTGTNSSNILPVSPCRRTVPSLSAVPSMACFLWLSYL